jgi:hypothetical protein
VIASFLFVFKIKLAFALKTTVAHRVPGNVSLTMLYRPVSRKTQIVLHHRAPLKYLISTPWVQIPASLALVAISVRNAAFANLMVAVIASELVLQRKLSAALKTPTDHRVPGEVSLPTHVKFETKLAFKSACWSWF